MQQEALIVYVLPLLYLKGEDELRGGGFAHELPEGDREDEGEWETLGGVIDAQARWGRRRLAAMNVRHETRRMGEARVVFS